MPIPWTAILRHAPMIVSAAQTLVASQTKKVNEQQQSIQTRLDELEKASAESARLVREIAEQLQALTVASEEARKQVRLALMMSGGALVAAGAAIVLAFLQ